jgi:nitroimidazol reductase NimA-like FMN-containing flavoprotein (pyridoxamine 5'-phosphate oxidase superfamily)
MADLRPGRDTLSTGAKGGDVEELTRGEMIAMLKQELVGHLGITDGSEPYVTPISFVHSGESLYLRTGPGRRLSALQANPLACVEVSRYTGDDGSWESVVLWGRAMVLGAHDDEADEAIGLLMYKYRAAFTATAASTEAEPLAPDEVVVKIPIERMSGRRSAAGLSAHLRPGRL